MTIDEFVAALREAMPEMHSRQWRPTMHCREKMLRFDRGNLCHCPITAVCEVRTGRLYAYWQVGDAAGVPGLADHDMQCIVAAVDDRHARHPALRSRLIGAYQDYCATLRATPTERP